MEMTELCENHGPNPVTTATRVKHWMTILGLALMVVGGQPGLSFANELDSLTSEETIEGEVIVIHVDEIDQVQSHTEYFLQKSGSSEVIELMFDGPPPQQIRKHLKTGKKLRIKGKKAERRAARQAKKEAKRAARQAKKEAKRAARLLKKGIVVNEVAALGGEGSTNVTNGNTAQAATGDRKTITFVINMSGVDYTAEGASPYDQTHVAAAGKAMHDPGQYSVHSAYEEASFGQVTFSGSAATDVFLVSIPYDSSKSCNYRGIASQADAVSPVSLNGYRHKMYVVPPKAISGCGWLALGEVGRYDSTSTRKSWSTRIDPIAFAHELGHNIGWHHAATDPDNNGAYNVEYGDRSDLMGYCCSKRKLNSVHVDQAGWFDQADLQNRILDVNGAGNFNLAPLGTDPTTSSDPQILRITPTSGWPYYLSYRQRTGHDSSMSSTYTTGLSIHRGQESGNWSYLITVLNDNELFQDAGNGIMVSQVTHNANYVTVDVSFSGNQGCVVGGTQVSLTPGSQTALNLQATPQYTVTLTNRDSSACGTTNFVVALDQIGDGNGGAASGISGVVKNTVLAVQPGKTKTTTVTMNLGAVANGTYSIPVRISNRDSSVPKHTQTAMGTLQVQVKKTQVPLPPSVLTATLGGGKRVYITLQWNPPSDAPKGTMYRVYRNGNLVGSTKKLQYKDKKVSLAQSNVYEVYTVSRGGIQSTTPARTTYIAVPPNAPTGLTSTLGGGKRVYITLQWNPPSDAPKGTSYQVYRNGSLVGSTKKLQYKDKKVSLAQPNVYEVYTVGRGGMQSTTPARTTYIAVPPNAPTGLTSTLGGGKRIYITLQWNPPSDAPKGTMYRVYRNGSLIGSTKKLQYKDKKVSLAQLNTYEVYTVGRGGMLSIASARTVINN